MAERRKRISVAQVTALLRRIRELPIRVETVDPDRAFDQIIARGDRRRSTDKRPCTSLLGCRTLGETPWLDVQTVAVVLHLLICNGGKRWNPRSPSRAKPPSRNLSVNILGCGRVIGLSSSC